MITQTKTQSRQLSNQRLQIIRIIFEAIDELNEQLPEDRRLDQDVNTILFGESGNLKSLELVNLILLIEEKLEEEFDVLVSLTDEKAMSPTRSPFRTVDRLANYIDLLIMEFLV